jgi:hypothetical protein
MRTNEEMKEELRAIRKELLSDVHDIWEATGKVSNYILYSEHPDIEQFSAMNRSAIDMYKKVERLRGEIEL